MRNAYKILSVKPEGKRPPGSPTRSWGGRIKMDLTEMGCRGVNCILLAQDRVSGRLLRILYRINGLYNTLSPHQASRDKRRFR
jgi:hypothetical protein